jgi:hypothetical protein
MTSNFANWAPLVVSVDALKKKPSTNSIVFPDNDNNILKKPFNSNGNNLEGFVHIFSPANVSKFIPIHADSATDLEKVEALLNIAGLQMTSLNLIVTYRYFSHIIQGKLNKKGCYFNLDPKTQLNYHIDRQTCSLEFDQLPFHFSIDEELQNISMEDPINSSSLIKIKKLLNILKQKTENDTILYDTILNLMFGSVESRLVLCKKIRLS